MLSTSIKYATQFFELFACIDLYTIELRQLVLYLNKISEMSKGLWGRNYADIVGLHVILLASTCNLQKIVYII